MARFVCVPLFDIYDEDTGQWVSDENFWLEGELIYHSDLIGEDGLPVVVTVPDKFITDFASLPRFPTFIRAVLLKNGKHRPAAVVHDYLCRLKKAFPRRLADRIFLEAMGIVGVKTWHRYVMYWAVRLNTERMILQGVVDK